MSKVLRNSLQHLTTASYKESSYNNLKCVRKQSSLFYEMYLITEKENGCHCFFPTFLHRFNAINLVYNELQQLHFNER